MKMTPSRLRLMTPAERRLYDEEQQLFKALGEFFLLWADAELELYRVLRHYASTSDEVARAIFSGSRARTMMDYVRNIAHNTGMEKDRSNDLEYLFGQMATINNVRDKVAHYASASGSVSHAPLERSLSNYYRASRTGNAFHMGINSAIVEQMSDDLRRIQYRLRIHHDKTAPTALGVDVPRDGPAWRYIPAQPIQPKGKNPQTPQARQRQQKSSPK